MSESDIESKSKKYALRRGWEGHKLQGTGNTHKPDDIFTKSIYLFYVEFKKNKGPLSEGQKACIRQMQLDGCIVYVVRTFSEFKDALRLATNRFEKSYALALNTRPPC